MKTLTERQIGYLAAMVDGEGCFSLGRNKRTNNKSYSPNVSVCNTNTVILRFCQEITGIGIVEPTSPQERNWKARYRWRILADDIVDFLTVIQPSLIGKWEQAELILEYFRECQGRKGQQVSEETHHYRQSIFDELAELNRREYDTIS